MTSRTALRCVVALGGLYIVAETVGLALQFVTGVSEDQVVGLGGKVAGGFVFLAWAAIGGVIAVRRPRNAIGWIIVGIALTWAIQDLTFGYGVYALVSRQGELPGGAIAAITDASIFFLAMLLITLLFLLFPEGHALDRRWRLVGWASLVTSVVLFLGTFLDEGPIEPADVFHAENPYGVIPAGGVDDAIGIALFVLLFGMLCAAVAQLVIRLRRSRGDLRQQMRWFAYAAGFLVASFTLIFFGPNETTDVVGSIILGLGIIGVPAAAAIAIFKYRLYDIDVVINKTVVVGILVAFATLVYVAVVVGVGTLIGNTGEQPSVLLAVLATAIVAVAFQPVRTWAHRTANRVAYGDRATPYDVLSDFSDRLGDTFDARDLLPRMARMLAEGTAAAHGDVWLRVADELRLSGSWPVGSAPRNIELHDGSLPAISDRDLVEPVLHHGELLGALAISKKTGERLTPIEERLVRDLAAQAGLVLSNVRLIEELRASRQRLVAAQDEERRRLERNLHDGAQQQIVALALKQRLAEGLLDRDPDRARALLTELQADATDALDTLRDLAHGIYPPVLADKGLPDALRAHVRRSPLPVDIDANGVGRYPQEIEAAAYFCCLEALQNVAKYAHASRAQIGISSADGVLTFLVADDGVGFELAAHRDGSGLQGMADRVEALGGSLEVVSRPEDGTKVIGRIPVGDGVTEPEPISTR